MPPGEPVSNDYYIRNPDKSTETLRIATDAEITASRCPLCRNGQPGNVVDFLASFMKKGKTYADPYRGAEISVLADDRRRHRRRDRRAVRALSRRYIRKMPNFVSGIGAFSAAEIPSASTRRVSSGSMIPSSQSRAVE